MSEQRQPGEAPRFELRHRLARALEDAGLKPEDMATMLGKSPTTIRNYLSGRTTPDRSTIFTWASCCSVPFRWLDTGNEDVGPDDGPGVDVLQARTQGNVSTIWERKLAVVPTFDDAAAA